MKNNDPYTLASMYKKKSSQGKNIKFKTKNAVHRDKYVKIITEIQ